REGEGRPVGAAGARNRATVGFDDRADDRQPEPGARDIAGGGAAEESLEQARLLRLRNADAVVGNARDDLALLCGQRQLDVATLGGELDCVRERVVEDLAEPVRVRLRAERRGPVVLERDSLRCGSRI